MNLRTHITHVFSFFFFLFSFSAASAQNLQWAQRGGSAQSVSSAQWETADDMATDVNGNVYVLSRSAVGTVNVAGQTKADNGGRDVVLASFRCDGTLRWWHVIGNPFNDYAGKLQVDKLDGVYITINPDRTHGGASTLKSDNDTLGNGVTYKTLHLIKYDTSGVYKWMRTPEADTVTLGAAYTTGSYEMNADSAGNVYWLCMLKPGLYGGTAGYVVTDTSYNILKYDRNGVFKGGFPIAISNVAQDLDMSRNPRNGNFYFVNGTSTTVTTPTIEINGTPVGTHRYIACFDKDGNFLWIKKGPSSYEAFSSRPVFDKEDNIYLGTGTKDNDTFQNYITKGLGLRGGIMIVKLDKDGNLLWAQTGRSTAAASFGRGGLALRNSGEVVLQSKAGGNFKWLNAKDSLIIPTGYHTILNRFNTQTGKLLGMEMPASTGQVTPTVLVSDARNNIFAGGEFTASMTINGNTVNNVGGESDFYVYKYGYNNCNCTNIPEPNFSMVRDANNKVSFTYTGSTGISSYKWDFDDGDTSSSASPVLTYTKTGAITACVTVRNSCGDNTYCKSFYLFPTSVEYTAATNNNIKVYPNPANDAVHIEGIAAGTGIQIFDVTGRQVYQSASTSTNASINISSLSTGSYVLVLTATDGTRTTRKLMKN